MSEASTTTASDSHAARRGSRQHIRFASLGDSATYGLGDPVGAGWRGWAQLLADAMAECHDVSFENFAIPGATAAEVRRTQLADALAHRPHVASLVVGLNDTMRSGWNPARLHEDLLHCAGSLQESGALLLTARFHDHSRVFGLPRFLGKALGRRIEAVNDVYDEIHARFGGLRIDLAAHEAAYSRSFWSVDRLHPSEAGHRILAHEGARLLNDRGFSFPAPSTVCTSPEPGRLDNARWLVGEGGPWIGRRLRDLGPWAARSAIADLRVRTQPRTPDSLPVRRPLAA